MIFRNKWSNWLDVSIGKVHEHVYLLQYRRHENGKVESPSFKTVTTLLKYYGFEIKLIKSTK